MSATAFDTLAAARELKAATAGIARRADAADRETLATKADLEAGIASLEARLTRRLVMPGAAIGGMLAAAVAMLKFL